MGSIQRMDPRLDELVSRDAKIEKLASGFQWAEGPVWVKDGGYLLFSDVKSNVIIHWSADHGAREFIRPSGYTGTTPRGEEMGSNGLTIDKEGKLVACQHGDRRIARRDDGGWTTLVDSFEGRKFNSPNDLIYASNGDLYFTDPGYGLEGGNNGPNRQIPFNGVYRLSPSGRLTLLTKQLTFPNGLALSPDEKTLYITVSDPKRAVVMAYDVHPEGIVNGRVFFDATAMIPSGPGLPDGLKVDEKGNVFVTGPGGILVLTPEAKLLGVIRLDQPTGNLAWGENGSVLYITSNHDLCRMRVRTRGTIVGEK